MHIPDFGLVSNELTRLAVEHAQGGNHLLLKCLSEHNIIISASIGGAYCLCETKQLSIAYTTVRVE